jgi:hypothetical protein
LRKRKSVKNCFCAKPQKRRRRKKRPGGNYPDAGGPTDLSGGPGPREPGHRPPRCGSIPLQATWKKTWKKRSHDMMTSGDNYLDTHRPTVHAPPDRARRVRLRVFVAAQKAWRDQGRGPNHASRHVARSTSHEPRGRGPARERCTVHDEHVDRELEELDSDSDADCDADVVRVRAKGARVRGGDGRLEWRRRPRNRPRCRNRNPTRRFFLFSLLRSSPALCMVTAPMSTILLVKWGNLF